MLQGTTTAPAGLSAAAGDGGVAPAWTAPLFPPPVTGYQVQRAADEAFTEGLMTFTTTGTKTAYTDTTADAGRSYFYRVRTRLGGRLVAVVAAGGGRSRVNLPEVLMGVAAGIGILAALTHFLVGFSRRPRDRARIAFAVASAAAAAGALSVLALYVIHDIDLHIAVMKWAFFPATVLWTHLHRLVRRLLRRRPAQVVPPRAHAPGSRSPWSSTRSSPAASSTRRRAG